MKPGGDLGVDKHFVTEDQLNDQPAEGAAVLFAVPLALLRYLVSCALSCVVSCVTVGMVGWCV